MAVIRENRLTAQAKPGSQLIAQLQEHMKHSSACITPGSSRHMTAASNV